MKKSLFLLLGMFVLIIGKGQDTLIDKGIYQVLFRKELRLPIEVTYTLYHGGGPCSRGNDHFKGDKYTLHDKDYLHSGFDRGHLVPAEDFAYNDSLQALTFYYYNCVPQYPSFNRGVWKQKEAQIRRLSQTDTLRIRIRLDDFRAQGNLMVPHIFETWAYDKGSQVYYSELRQ